MNVKASMVMRVTALIVGILGAMAGFLVALLLLGLVIQQSGFGHEVPSSSWMITGVLGAMSAVGLVGAVLAVAKPKSAVVLLLISVIGGVIASYLFSVVYPIFAVAAVPPLIAVILAFFGRNKLGKVAL